MPLLCRSTCHCSSGPQGWMPWGAKTDMQLHNLSPRLFFGHR